MSLAGIIRSVKKSDMVKYHIYRMEQLMRRCDEESKKVRFCYTQTHLG